MAPPESFEFQNSLLSKILAVKGLPLRRLSKTPRGCGSSNTRLRAANSNSLAATVKPVRILMSNINNLVDFVIFDFVISDCSLIYIPMFAVLSMVA